jgi:hypothetical protein
MASRDLYSAMTTELTSDRFEWIMLFHGEFTAGDVYLSTYDRELTWNSQTWTGTGGFGGISDSVEETVELSARGVTLQLSGIPSGYISMALQEVSHGTKCHLYLGCLDTTTGALIENVSPQSPYKFYTGIIDVPSIHLAGETSIITLKTENQLIILDTPRERRYTLEDHKLDYPDDLGFEFVPKVQEQDEEWG